MGISMTSKDYVSILSSNGKVYLTDLSSMRVALKKEIPNKVIFKLLIF